MKKYACLVFFALLLNGCDDGNLTVDTIDFDSVTTITSCDTTSTLLYKLKTQEALLLQLPQSTLTNNPDTLTYDIDNSSYRVVYRAYDGTVATSNICGAIPPKTPNVIEEWVGTAGKINVVTKQNLTNPKEDGSTRIESYTHNIVFNNITFLKPSGPQTEEEYVFGNYTITVTQPTLTFSTPDEAYFRVNQSQNQVYNYNTTFYIMIQNFDKTMFKTETTSTPEIRNITATANNVVYRPMTGTLTSDYFTFATPPTTPSIKETWNGTNGTVEVSTEKSGNSLRYTIVLKNVTLKKGNSFFSLGNNFSLGTYSVLVPQS